MRGAVVAAQCRTDTALTFCCSGGSPGLPGWRLFRGFTLLSPFSHSSPSLTGLLASVDVKQQILSLWFPRECQHCLISQNCVHRHCRSCINLHFLCACCVGPLFMPNDCSVSPATHSLSHVSLWRQRSGFHVLCSLWNVLPPLA